MERGGHPLLWCRHIDEAGNMLARLDVPKTELMLRRQIVCHSTDGCDVLCPGVVISPAKSWKKEICGTGLPRWELQNR